jgi:DNA-binding NarL/FixJ family response regulator
MALDTVVRRRLLLTLRSRHPEAVVVGVAARVTADGVRQALLLGADTVIDVGIAPAVAAGTVVQATRGMTCIPIDIARAVADVPPTPAVELTDEQLEWLRRLAERGDIEKLARSTHHSRSAMYSRLSKLHHQLRVKSNDDAVRWAADRGLL